MYHVAFCCRDVPVERLRGRRWLFKYVGALRAPMLTLEDHLFLSPHASRISPLFGSGLSGLGSIELRLGRVKIACRDYFGKREGS